MFQGLFKGDLPDRLQASARLVSLSSAGFLTTVLVMEGVILWDETLPLIGFFTVLGFSILASLYHHYLRLDQAISRWRYLRGSIPDAVLLVVMGLTVDRPELMALFASARVFVVVGRVFANTGFGRRLLDSLTRNPAKLIVVSFSLAILLGTVMLTFPRATTDGRGASAVDALFTATSATCVTGLVVMNTNPDRDADPSLPSFSLFGQIIILILIQIGGLGITTLSASALLMLGGRLSVRGTALMGNLLEEDGAVSLFRMIRYILGMTLVFEGLGAVVLTGNFALREGDLTTGVWYGVFHSVSAFCNAGFALYGNSLMHFATDPVVNLTVTSLIIVGGIGFPVIAALVSRQNWSHGFRLGWKKLGVHTRLVLWTTAGLIAGGFLLLLIVDANGAQENLSVSERLWVSYFQSVSARTAGFNTIDMTKTSSAAFLVYLVLMFVGASPGSAGGGIKTTTFALLLLSVRAALRGCQDVAVMGRTVPRPVIHRAVAVTLLSGAACAGMALLLLATQEGLTTEQILFEVVSAFGTVGLSLGATPKLDAFGRILVSALMFIGRCGPLTLSLALSQRQAGPDVRYPECKVVVG